MPVQALEATRPTEASSTIAAGIFARHRHNLLLVARLHSNSADDAEEALQDALILFIENYDSASGAPPLPWLTLTLKRRCWAIAKRAAQERRRIRDLGRDRDRQPSTETLGRPEAVVEKRELTMLRRRHLAELKRDERRALMLIGFGYSYKEICAMTGWTYTKVNRCIREGRAALRAGD